MESKNNNQEGSNQNKSLNQQILNILPIISQSIFLLLQIFYYCFESIYYTFIPVKPTSVKGEIVLVTGGGHGIGKQLALVYASEGATVICWDVNEANNEATVKDIAKKGYPKAYSYVCDVSDRESVFKVAEKVREEVGNVTILINNAGIMPTHSLEEHTEQEIRRIMDINVIAHCWTIQAFLPDMKKANHGHIVGISSIAGVTGIPNLVPYTASKYAVRGLMESLVEELRWNPKNNIKTTTICPFMVNTGLCKHPFVKFENALNLLEPEYTAKQIMHAQRTGVVETTIPNFLKTVNAITRLLPYKMQLKIRDFFASGVHSDLQ